MTLKQLQKKRATLVREAEALRVNGEFPTDEARAAFDAKMTAVEAIDAQIRALVEDDDDDEGEDQARDAGATEQARKAGASAERDRITGIQDAVRFAKLEPSVAADMVKRNLTLDQARAEVFRKLAETSEQTPTTQHVRVGEDARDKWVRGAGNWLLVRSGMAALVAQFEKTEVRTIDPGEFRGMSLIDLAKEALTRHGVTVRGLDRMEIAGRAMAYRSSTNYQTTSDFATLLENTMHKVLRAAYGITPDTWSRFCGIGTTSDFRTHNWYRTGALTVLEDLNEVGEFRAKNIPDAEKATFQTGTKGNVIGISRQVIVNDDIGFVMRLTAQLGRAGKLTIEKAVYALLGQNSGLGPTQSDAQPLFHANRANVGTGAALAAAALDADRVVMAQQLDPNGQDYTDLRPSILLVPVSLGGQARVINESQYDPDTVANKAQMKANVASGLFRDIVDTPRISGTRRYLFADPSFAPVFLVSFLEGQQEPVLESQDGWRYDGVEMKARLDVGVDDVDYRGAVTNAGA